MTDVVITHIDSNEELASFGATTGPFTEVIPTVDDEVRLPSITNPGPYRVIHRRFVTDGINEIRLYVRELSP